MEPVPVIDSDKAVAEGMPGKINSAVAASIANGATAEQLRPVSDLGINLKARADAVALDAARHHKASPLLAGVETSVAREKTVDAGTITLVHGIAGRINTAVVQSRANGAQATELQPLVDLVYALEADAPVLAGAVGINTPAAGQVDRPVNTPGSGDKPTDLSHRPTGPVVEKSSPGVPVVGNLPMKPAGSPSHK